MERARRIRALVGAVLAVALLAACDGGTEIEGGETIPLLTVSDAWQAGADPQEVASRVRALTEGIERLRRDTGSGWIGRQDDVTGYLTELRGGTYTGRGRPTDLARRFVNTYGPDLFSAQAASLAFEREETAVATGVTTLRARQHVDDVPVDTGQLVFVVRDRRLVSISGRLFPALDLPTDPGIARRRAERIAVRSSNGGTVEGSSELLVMPDEGGGVLVWSVPIFGGNDPTGAQNSQLTIYLIDAIEGELLGTRPGSIELAYTPGRSQGPATAAAFQTNGEDVEVTGTGPAGEQLSASGVRQPDGTIALVDRTAPTYDAATGNGAITTHDVRGITDRNQFPGPLVTSSTTQIDDPEALAIHAYSRDVIDYFHDVMGRDSWDGAGGDLISSIHYGPPDYCNAFFNGRQMVYGNACVRNGQQVTTTFADIDVAAHEITHGVEGTSSALLYSGQSGALSESFSDYFGSVIGNIVKGIEDNRMAEGICHGITEPTPMCRENPQGLSLRYMLNDTTYTDFLYLLDLPYNLEVQLEDDQDHGGVHLNSAIWNNALWSIRDRLAKLDARPAQESERAQKFDATVYLALIRLTPGATFLDARTAVEQGMVDSALDPDSQRVVRETFDLLEVCAECLGDPGGTAAPASVGPGTQQTPAIAAGDVAWVEFSTGDGRGSVMAIRGGGPAAKRSNEGDDAVGVAFAGAQLMWSQYGPSHDVRVDDGTNVSVLDSDVAAAGVDTGVAGSPEGGAWWNARTGELNFYDPADGSVRKVPVPPEISGERLISIATGGRTVAAGGKNGAIVVWKVDEPAARVLARAPLPIYAIGAWGDRVLAITATDTDYWHGTATLYDVNSGQATELSKSASVFGAAVSGEYAVWAESLERLGGDVAAQRGTLPFTDTDLRLHSFASGQSYALLTRRGQQGFPSLAGNRLAWQDAANGGDDIYTAEVPGGL